MKLNQSVCVCVCVCVSVRVCAGVRVCLCAKAMQENLCIQYVTHSCKYTHL